VRVKVSGFRGFRFQFTPGNVCEGQNFGVFDEQLVSEAIDLGVLLLKEGLEVGHSLLQDGGRGGGGGGGRHRKKRRKEERKEERKRKRGTTILERWSFS